MNNKPKIVLFSDYKECDFKVKNISLEFDIYEEFTIVSSLLSIIKQNQQADNLVLDSIDLELLHISLDGVELKDSRYCYEDEKLTIFGVDDSFELKIINKIYPHLNSELEGLYKSGGIFCTQNEPEGFRRITPYLDRPDVMSVFKTTIKADRSKYPILLSNGNLLEKFDINDNRHVAIWLDPFFKPTYLFALVAGDLGVLSDEFITRSGKRVELNIYTDRGSESRCHHAMFCLKQAMKWDEDVYDREYDLGLYNIVAVDSFNMGAMENKGLNIFNSSYVLADELSATDADFMGIQSVIAHEYFHNWSGNRVTCKDWFELTLKEGLTVFRDQCFSADMNSSELQRIMDVKVLRDRQFSEDNSPTAHSIKPDSYIAINNFYTATIYEKGAEVIRMLHTLMGREKFKEAMNIYFDKFDAMAVRTDDFLWAMSEVCSIDMELFKRWYKQIGTPRLEVDESFSDGVYSIKLKQVIPKTPENKEQPPLYYPLKIAILDDKANELIEQSTIIKNEVEEFKFNLAQKPVLSINRDFSAPIIIEQKNPDHIFLMKHDKNGFARYEAAQEAMLKSIKDITLDIEPSDKFVEAYGYILEDDIELSLKAYMLDLPTINAIIQQEQDIDFEIIVDARDTLTKILATKYKESLLNLYSKNHNPQNRDLDPINIGKRAIKNRALKLLSYLDDERVAVALAKEQYKNSSSMNDKIAALDVLENISQNDEIEHFYKTYKQNTLLMQKYLSIIASSKREGTLSRIISLQKDDVYDENIPNLLRSLVGSFSRNYRYFHAKDGSGYEFITSKIVDIDKINPQMASSLSLAFKIAHRLNHHNKSIVKNRLEEIITTNNISKNVYEIISKILKATT